MIEKLIYYTDTIMICCIYIILNDMGCVMSHHTQYIVHRYNGISL